MNRPCHKSVPTHQRKKSLLIHKFTKEMEMLKNDMQT